MVNLVALVLLKEEKVLVEKASRSGSVKLPVIELSENEEPKGAISKWVKENVGKENVGTEVKKVEANQVMNDGKRDYNCILVDMVEKLAEESKLGDSFEWIELNELRQMDIFYNRVIKVVLEQCSREGYNSPHISALEYNLEKSYNLPNHFIRFRNTLARKRVDEESHNNRKLWAILFSLVMGAMFSVFFYDTYFGISFGIFTVLLALGFIQINKIKTKSFMGYFLLTSSIILSFGYSIFTNPVFRVLNVLFIPIGLFSGFLLLTYPDITLELAEYIKVFFSKVVGDTFATSVKLPSFIKKLFRTEKKQEGNTAYKSVLLGLVISIPVVLFLCLFLSGADSMFSYYLNNIAEIFNFNNLPDLFAQFIMSVIAAFLLFGFYWSLHYNFNASKSSSMGRKWFEPVTVLTLVLVVNILYLIFTMVQVSFLYGGKELPAGFSYAEYARNGFFQLVFIVVVNVLAITVIKLKTSSKSRKLDLALYVSYTTITLFTFHMAFSALYKMNLYINAFGYTRLRILVQAFTIFLAIVLCILIMFIWKGINLFKPIVISAVIIYAALNFVNIDNYIVKWNLRVIPTESKFDDDYAASLSFDAKSAMYEALSSGRLDKVQYERWVLRNKNPQKHWHEYNYYQSKNK